MLLLDYKRMLVDAINQANGTNFPFEEAEFGIPHDAYTIPSANPAVTNTLIRIVLGGKEHTWAYNRVTLSESFRDHQFNSRSLLRLQSITEDPRATVAASISAHYGYPMEPEDLVGSSIVVYEGVLSFETTVRSLRYRKERISLRLDGMYPRWMDDYWRVYEPARVEPEFWYEDRVDWVKLPDTVPRADMLTWGNDYSPVATQLQRYIAMTPWDPAYAWTNVARMTELAYALRSVDGLPWIFSTAAQTVGSKLNLMSSWILYNGPTDQVKAATHYNGRVPAEQQRMLDCANKAFTHVMMMRPNSASALTADKTISPSTLMLHYNLPGARNG